MSTEIKDKLDVLIALSAKDCGNDDVEAFNNLDTSHVSLDKEFYVRLKRIINRHKHSVAIITVKKCLVRVAVALMALMSVGFLTVMAVPQLRETVFEAVVEWYDNYVSIHFEPSRGENKEPTDTTSSEITAEPESSNVALTPPTIIEKVMKPTYLPDGAEEDIVNNSKAGVVIDYYLGDDVILSFNQTPYKDKDKLYDNKVSISYDIYVNGFNALALEFESSERAIIWTDGAYYFYVHSATLDIDELLKVASSVR